MKTWILGSSGNEETYSMPDNTLGAWVFKNEQARMVSAHARSVVGMRWWIWHFWLHKDQFWVTGAVERPTKPFGYLGVRAICFSQVSAIWKLPASKKLHEWDCLMEARKVFWKWYFFGSSTAVSSPACRKKI